MSLCVFLASESHITTALPFCQISLPQHLAPSLQAISINYQNLCFLLIGLFLCLPFKYYHSFRRATTLQSFKYMVLLQTVLSQTTSEQETEESWLHLWFLSTVSWSCWGAEVLSFCREHLALNQLSSLTVSSATSRKADGWGEGGAEKFYQLEVLS